jgi:hypothetical protein
MIDHLIKQGRFVCEQAKHRVMHDLAAVKFGDQALHQRVDRCATRLGESACPFAGLWVKFNHNSIHRCHLAMTSYAERLPYSLLLQALRQIIDLVG